MGCDFVQFNQEPLFNVKSNVMFTPNCNAWQKRKTFKQWHIMNETN